MHVTNQQYKQTTAGSLGMNQDPARLPRDRSCSCACVVAPLALIVPWGRAGVSSAGSMAGTRQAGRRHAIDSHESRERFGIAQILSRFIAILRDKSSQIPKARTAPL
jgi:hypothetical protein